MIAQAGSHAYRPAGAYERGTQPNRRAVGDQEPGLPQRQRAGVARVSDDGRIAW